MRPGICGLVLACLVLWAVPVAATPTVAAQNYAISVASDTVIALANVAPGNLIGVVVLSENDTTRTFTVTDECGHSYTAGADYQIHPGAGSEAAVYAWRILSATCTDASMDITVDESATHSGYAVIVFRVTCPQTCTADTTSELENASTTGPFSSADATVIDTTTEVLVVAACSGRGTHGGASASGYTDFSSQTSTLNWAAYRTSAGALSNERGTFTMTNAREYNCLIFSVQGLDAAGGVSSDSSGFLLRGVGSR